MLRNSFFTQLLALSLIVPVELYAQAGAVPLSITVMQGDASVVDEAHTPAILVRVTAVGASVTFRMPADAGVAFSNSKSQITVKTDPQGFASSGALTANAKGGKFDVEIEATYQGQTANAVAHETNAANIASTAKAHKSHTLLWVLIGAGAGGAVLAASMKGGSGGSGSSSAPTFTITAGNPTIGPPQ